MTLRVRDPAKIDPVLDFVGFAMGGKPHPNNQAFRLRNEQVCFGAVNAGLVVNRIKISIANPSRSCRIPERIATAGEAANANSEDGIDVPQATVILPFRISTTEAHSVSILLRPPILGVNPSVFANVISAQA
jgi:hypothetical protein